MAELEPLQQIDRTYVRVRNQKLSYFSGCDYFRLASHPKVIAALQQGVKQYGLNVAASRLTSGNHKLYQELERRLAAFFVSDSATLTSSGYLTNLVVGQTLSGNFSHALIDERSHPSLTDAARFLECPVLQFAHRDPNDLARSVQRCGPGAKPIVLTDGMFAHDGSAAPLDRYLKLLPRDGWILVDDAHGAGVLGRTGKGSLEHAGASRRRVIQTITLSKAFGAYGGAILGSAQLRERILDHSHLFTASTPLPLPLANAALRSLELLRTQKSFRSRLASNTAYVKSALRSAGFQLPEAPGPIVSILPAHARDVTRLKRQLLAAKIYPPFIKYPGGPASGYFRLAISSEHSREQLDLLLEVLADFTDAHL